MILDFDLKSLIKVMINCECDEQDDENHTY